VTPRLPRCFRFVCQWCCVARVIETVSDLATRRFSACRRTCRSLEHFRQSGKNVQVRHPSARSAERSTAASHLCRETRPASSFRVTRTSRSRRTWSSRRPSSLPAPSPRASARARATAPPRFARHRAPRASSPAAEPVRAPPISEVPPRRRRADAERDAPFDIPRAPGRALRTPRTDARGRPTRHRTDKAIVVRDFRNLDARSRFEPTAASDRAPPSFSRLSRSRTTRILMSSDRIPLFMSSLSLRDEQSRRARPGALSVACSA